MLRVSIKNRQSSDPQQHSKLFHAKVISNEDSAGYLDQLNSEVGQERDTVQGSSELHCVLIEKARDGVCSLQFTSHLSLILLDRWLRALLP